MKLLKVITIFCFNICISNTYINANNNILIKEDKFGKIEIEKEDPISITLNTSNGQKEIKLIISNGLYKPKNKNIYAYQKTVLSHEILGMHNKPLIDKEVYGPWLIPHLNTEKPEQIGFSDWVEFGGIYKIKLGGGEELLALLFNSYPAAPGSGWWYSVYGYDRKGDFNKFGNISAYGGLENKIVNSGEQNVKGYFILADNQFIKLSENADHFHVIKNYKISMDNISIEPVSEDKYEIKYVLYKDYWKYEAKEPQVDVTLFQKPDASSKPIVIRVNKNTKVMPKYAVQDSQSIYWLYIQIDNIGAWISNKDYKTLHILGLPLVG